MFKRESIILLFYLGITFWVSCSGSNPKRDLLNYTLTPEEITLLQEGDILLRHGYGYVSNMIVKTLDEAIPVSHVGLLTLNDEGNFMVIHSVSQSVSDADGVQIQELKSFVRDSQPYTLIVVRYKKLTEDPHAGTLITSQALNYLEQKVPFDYSFDFQDTERFFCTEFIARVIVDVFDDEIFSEEVLQNLPALDRLKFQFFFDEDRFDIVLNHHNALP